VRERHVGNQKHEKTGWLNSGDRKDLRGSERKARKSRQKNGGLKDILFGQRGKKNSGGQANEKMTEHRNHLSLETVMGPTG